MRTMVYYKPHFSKPEEQQIRELQEEIWNKLTDSIKPVCDGFICHSIKVIKDDVIEVLDTSTNPYMPINNRYLLKLISDNICKVDDDEEETV